jgi:4'-phosphopantetheinyl transferase EntD
MPDLDHLAAVARGLLPEGAAVAAADPGQLYPLLPGEALPGAIPSRGREFSAGRHAARTALALLGLPSCPIPQGDDRAPVWPSGISGSITHTHLACLAAVIRGPVLGLDLEEDLPLDTFLWDSILGPEEQAWASGAPDPGLAAKLIFSAKEAAYKAQYPIGRQLFGFDTLAIAVTDDRFTATFRHSVLPFAGGHVLQGRHSRAEGHILTVVTA